MVHVLVLYATNHGQTRAAAQTLAEGSELVAGTAVRCLSVEDVEPDDVLDADAVVLGTPVHMGSVHWSVKRFIDETLSRHWSSGAMEGRIGGVFATGGGLGGAGGGCELAMLSMLSVLAELGLLIVPLPRSTPHYAAAGLHWGPYVRCADASGIPHGAPDAAGHVLRAHGCNIAQVAAVSARLPDRSVLGRPIPTHAPRSSA